LQKKLPSLPDETALGPQAYNFFLKNIALLPYTPEQLLDLSRAEWARCVAFETYEEGRDKNVPPLRIFPDTETWIRKAAADEAAIRAFLETNNILSVPAGVKRYTLRPMPDYLKAVSSFGETDDLTGPSRLSDDGTRYVEKPSENLGFFWLATA